MSCTPCAAHVTMAKCVNALCSFFIPLFVARSPAAGCCLGDFLSLKPFPPASLLTPALFLAPSHGCAILFTSMCLHRSLSTAPPHLWPPPCPPFGRSPPPAPLSACRLRSTALRTRRSRAARRWPPSPPSSRARRLARRLHQRGRRPSRASLAMAAPPRRIATRTRSCTRGRCCTRYVLVVEGGRGGRNLWITARIRWSRAACVCKVVGVAG